METYIQELGRIKIMLVNLYFYKSFKTFPDLAHLTVSLVIYPGRCPLGSKLTDESQSNQGLWRKETIMSYSCRESGPRTTHKTAGQKAWFETLDPGPIGESSCYLIQVLIGKGCFGSYKRWFTNQWLWWICVHTVFICPRRHQRNAVEVEVERVLALKA